MKASSTSAVVGIQARVDIVTLEGKIGTETPAQTRARVRYIWTSQNHRLEGTKGEGVPEDGHGRMTDQPLARHAFEEDEIEASLEFLKRTRSELSTLRKVHFWPDRLAVFDVNGEWFALDGVGYLSEQIVTLLDAVDAVYKRESLHVPIAREYKEFLTGRRYAWGADRVM